MKEKNSLADLAVSEGKPETLGASVCEEGINFAVFSANATSIRLLLFEKADDIEPSAILPMHKTDDIFHLFVSGLTGGAYYLFTVSGPNEAESGHRFDESVALLDPYCKLLTGATAWHAPANIDDTSEQGIIPKCVVVGENQFDWQGDERPKTPLCESVIYEVHLRGFTGHDSSPVLEKRGTYRAFIEQIPYLKELGITAVEFLPMMEWYRPTEFVNPETGAANTNDWGYDTLSYMAPDEALASSSENQVDEFKLLVRELHKAGIEVILDIVLNHTAESDETGPSISFRGLDNKSYYLLKPEDPAQYTNFTGCGNTVNCNHPKVTQLILDVLRYWVTEYHIDGFRFDLCAVFGIDTDLSVKPDTPVLKAISTCPILSEVKLIAEPWAIGAYLMGRFPAPFAEWSDRYRDTVRSFVRGEAGFVSDLARVVSGSTDMFGDSRLPINFVTAHDGFSMMDLVSYDNKRNEANGEENRDGSSYNRSWNCGYEGALENSGLAPGEIERIEKLRRQQIKNFFVLLMVSRGVPMMLYGDEMGRTNFGNNNTWNQAELNSLDWGLLEQNPDLHDFVRELIAFRKQHKLGGRFHETAQFRPITMHGVEPNKPDHSDGTRFLAWELGSFEDGSGEVVYCATNGYWEAITVSLPAGDWEVAFDTSKVKKSSRVESGSITIEPRSTLVLTRKR